MLWSNIALSGRARRSYSSGSSQALRGLRTSAGTSGTAEGTWMPKIGSRRVGTSRSRPSTTARTIARVWAMEMRWPMPCEAPTRPVLRIQTWALWRVTRSISMFAYVAGGSTRNGAAKQVLNVASGSVTPRSVPATFAV